MHRLLQGEVGSGKTVVALRAMLAVDRRRRPGGPARADRGARPAAPPLDHRRCSATLAEGGLLGGADIGTRVALLTGSQPTGGAAGRCSGRRHGDAGIVVGTHALIQEHVAVPRPRRWWWSTSSTGSGSSSGTRCASKGQQPAAPAGHDGHADPADRRDDGVRRPGDVDAHASCRPGARRSRRTSSSVEARVAGAHLAAGRARRSARRPPGLRRVPADRRPGRPSAADDVEAEPPTPTTTGPRRRGRTTVAPRERRWRCSTWRELRARARSPGLRIEVLHGRLAADVKDDGPCAAFAAGEIDVLVATTVIEVGVDVAERHRDGGHGRRPVRDLPAAPAARPGRPGGVARALPAGHRRPSRARRPGSGSTRSRRRPTGSSWPGSTSSCAARATCSAPRQSGRRLVGCGSCGSGPARRRNHRRRPRGRHGDRRRRPGPWPGTPPCATRVAARWTRSRRPTWSGADGGDPG